ncbi:MAG: L,D-transpeptidase family protein [Cardiobacteriaceae bacterium]|nr:L,D-transpeptidase family protein [Cardiobacteriaceae bacterium]
MSIKFSKKNILAAIFCFSLIFTSYAQENSQQTGNKTEEIDFDAADAVVSDQLPPSANKDEKQALAEVADTVEIVEEAPKPIIPENMQPFNSRKADLMEFLQSEPKKVVINGTEVKLKNPNLVADFYRLENYPTIWTQENSVLPNINQLQSLFDSVSEDALNPNTYHAETIKFLQAGNEYQDIVQLEVLATDAWLSLNHHLENGLLNPKKIDKTWNAPQVDSLALSHRLAEAFVAGDLVAPVKAINSADTRYQALKQRYLSATGAEADKIAINMERIRWLAPDWYQNRYVLANIPAFEVKVVENGADVFVSRSVVGKPATPTPRFVNSIKHIVVAPKWTVPSSVMKEKKVRLLASPGSFDGGYEAVDAQGRVVRPSELNWGSAEAGAYKLRQKSGKSNSLGLVKILFPNPHAVYMHDTPSKGLFNNAYRAASHGCVRLQKPFDLAALLLKDTNWDLEKLKTTAGKGQERWINPTQETPVYLVYWTMWPDTDGKMRTAKDLYKLDAEMIKAYKAALQ